MTADRPATRRALGPPLGDDGRAVRAFASVLWAVAVSLLVIMAVPALRDLVQPFDEAVREFVLVAEQRVSPRDAGPWR